jgi:hypothetical protein
METWEIILHDWVTIDWGYNDLAVGEAFSSPIGVLSYDLRPAAERYRRVERLDGPAPVYRVTCEIIEVSPDGRGILDGAVCPFAVRRLPEGLTKGDYATCEIELGIDYPETHDESYDWEVKAITRCTVPRIPNRSSHIPDWERHTCQRVTRTDGWRDGQCRDVHVWYVLHCRKIEATDPIWNHEGTDQPIHQWDRRMSGA